ncbi:hypothetical protein [Methylovirgula sp. 4M-Z18]|uniref:hypothetical protein n=1 Tax=Methylovirgula sp. 4M-Z18 TaxID=2293567 RepID=UPI000E2FE623|nr:hypothetical protein [Methylovirgula sp. 4M-Z18]RFB81331.1 hypothetical protein DYH55_07825 [Methylovirgula sp. 4M-Z18]
MASQNNRHDDDDNRPSSRANLAGIAVAIVVALVAVWLVFYLQKQRAIEDCINSGRRDCVPLDTSN